MTEKINGGKPPKHMQFKDELSDIPIEELNEIKEMFEDE
jgi:hypothetical protein